MVYEFFSAIALGLVLALVPSPFLKLYDRYRKSHESWVFFMHNWSIHNTSGQRRQIADLVGNSFLVIGLLVGCGLSVLFGVEIPPETWQKITLLITAALVGAFIGQTVMNEAEQAEGDYSRMSCGAALALGGCVGVMIAS